MPQDSRRRAGITTPLNCQKSKATRFFGQTGCGSRSFRSFGQELFDVLVSVVALTDFHQAGKMEFHPSFDLARRNVITTRFQTLRGIDDPQLDTELCQQLLEPTGKSGSLHAYPHADSSLLQVPIESFCFSLTVVQLPFVILSRLFHKKRNRLKARVVVYSYKHHVRLLSPEPLVVETTTVYPGQGADIVMQSCGYRDRLARNARICDRREKVSRSWKQIAPFNRIFYCIPIGSSCDQGNSQSPE